jgi:hypothetical protein
LLKKLGIEPEMKILVIYQPRDYFEWLGADVSYQFAIKNETPDFIHLFAESLAVFKKEMIPVLKFSKNKKR